ncbi:MAG: kstR2 9 [Frankiales bacterium]|nr:kstR2 9 [Frankiales bacterium]
MTELDPVRALGARVRRFRVARGVSLRSLAAQLDVSPATLSAVENGHTRLSALRLSQVAGLLDVSVDELLPRAPAPKSRPTPPTGAGWRDFPVLTVEPALAGALAAFLELGYAGATVRDISERAGMSVAGLYHHHASKQELLVALLDLAMDDLLARSRAAVAEGADPVERLSLLVECLALFHTHRQELGFIGASEMRSLGPTARARVTAARRDQQRMVDDQVVQGCAAGRFATTRPHEAARAVVTMCTALPQWFSTAGPASPEQVAAHYVEFALDLVRLRRDPATAGRQEGTT